MSKEIKAIQWFYDVSEKEAKKRHSAQSRKNIDYITYIYINRPKHCPRYN